MYNISPKLRPQIIKQQDEDEGSCCTLRCWLLVWAILRLIVSVLWTGTIMSGTIAYLHRYNEPQEKTPSYYHDRGQLLFDVFAILVQLVEFGMIVTFITAGIKKSASLYRAYYRYCILTLILYIIAVILCTVLVYDDGHYFGEIYLTYHINEFPMAEEYFYLAFDFVAVLVVGLEILLICLIKKLINKYSITTSCQNV